jgi:hypothetical protein
MSSEVATTKTFQDRMFERIRDQMGDLMTDDDLRKIVDTAVQKAFFETTTIQGSWGQTQSGPPIFVKMMEQEMRERVRTQLDEWLKANDDKVQECITKVIQEGIFRAMMNVLEQRMNLPLQQFADQLRQKGVLG